MELTLLTAARYAEAFGPHTLTPYGSVAFNSLNASKADSLVYAAMCDSSGRYRLGIIAGLRDRRACCPFSAPFGEITANGRQKLETVATFVAMLRDHFGPGNLAITLPPAFYDELMLPRVAGCLAAAGRQDYADFNYHYRLDGFGDFAARLDANARNHLNRALRAGFEFAPCPLADAYAVIQANRREKGYPLRMTLDALQATAAIIPVDSFLLTLGGAPAAAAIVYRLNDRVAQVIYWGHLGVYSDRHPMNLLAREVFGHYAAAGLDIVDVGPASSDGLPDMGLCTFKESLGCHLTFKPRFTL